MGACSRQMEHLMQRIFNTRKKKNNILLQLKIRRNKIILQNKTINISAVYIRNDVNSSYENLSLKHVLKHISSLRYLNVHNYRIKSCLCINNFLHVGIMLLTLFVADTLKHSRSC